MKGARALFTHTGAVSACRDRCTRDVLCSSRPSMPDRCRRRCPTMLVLEPVIAVLLGAVVLGRTSTSVASTRC